MMRRVSWLILIEVFLKDFRVAKFSDFFLQMLCFSEILSFSVPISISLRQFTPMKKSSMMRCAALLRKQSSMLGSFSRVV